MKKTHTLLLALFLCLALIFPCALAEDAYVSGQRTQALIDAALDAGQVVGGETRLTLQLGDEILSMLSGDTESQTQLDALMEVINGVRFAGGFGKLEDGYRVELGGSYTAPSGDNVFVTAAANLTLDGVSIESNLIEGERLSIRWETLLRLLGLTDDEVNQIMALRDVDWDSAMEELSTVVAQAAEEIGKLVEPYLATFADFLASLDIQQRDNVAAEGDYPAVDHEISVTCTAEDLGRLFHTLADQMERDDALLPYIEQLVANTTVTFTSDSGETTRTTTTAEFFDGMREFADSLMLEDATLGILVGYNDDGLPFYLTAAQTLDDETVAFYLQINPGETENATVFTLTMLEADDEGDLSDRVDADMTLVLDPADPNAFSVELNVQSTELNLYYAVTETAVTTEENLPGYKATFSMTISEPDETSGLRIVYNGEGLTSLTATDGEKSTFSMTANIYDESDDPIDILVESGLLIEPGDVRMLAAYLARYALDENYRHEMGEALYRRGKADFSEEATGLRQLEIYNAVFRMERNRRDGVRDGVLICGAYGFGNTGDDAILQAIIGEMRRIDPHMPVTVLSRRPKDTRSAYGVNACNRFHVPAIRRILRRSQLFISGGGSLMQDVTSRLSLWYYLGTIRMARRCGCKVQMYGCGIGPIIYERDRQLAARIINTCVDKITLREPDSRETLADFGVTEPEVILASDPALTLPAAERSRIDRILREHDMDPEGKYIGFVLRKWPGIEEKATVFAAGAVYAYLKYGLTPVFLSINFRTDGEASQLVTEHLSIPFYTLDEQMSTGEVIGVLSRMTAVVSMRLHGLIFAAGQGVPLIGVAYDPKVTAFLDYVEQNNYMQFEAVNEKDLSDRIDAAVALAGRGEEMRRRTELLNRQEDNNRATAARLLGKE